MGYVRKTRDEIVIEQNFGHGWEEVCVEESWTAARARKKGYVENQPEYPVRIRSKRVKLEGGV